MKWDFHVHSRYSYDSLSDPKALLQAARGRGLRGFAITDHNTIDGALEIQRLRRREDPIVVIGEEVATEAGDIVGLFLEREVVLGSAERVGEDIHAQGGLVVLPHPYRGHRVDNALLRIVDVVEAINARTPPRDNERALMMARVVGKPGIAVSDAHFTSHLGVAWIECTSNDVQGAILKGDFVCAPGHTSAYWTALSQLIKSAKLGHAARLPPQMGKLFIGLIRRAGYGGRLQSRQGRSPPPYG